MAGLHSSVGNGEGSLAFSALLLVGVALSGLVSFSLGGSHS